MNQRRSAVGISRPVSGLPLVEPDQVCEACGALGTVGKVVIAARVDVSEAVHRYCINCWPIESARHRARIKEHLRSAMDHAFTMSAETPNVHPADASRATSDGAQTDAIAAAQVDAKSRESTSDRGDPTRSQREFGAFSRVGATRVAGFESATWHQVENTIEKFQELLHMVRSDAVPTLGELEVTARELAEEIMAEAETRVGRMPLLVSSFLEEFGPDGDFRMPLRETHEESHAALEEAVAAAHASADEVIAAFDEQLKTLTLPTTETERAAVETELVGMLEQLHEAIEGERGAALTSEAQMEKALESGNRYIAQKLAREAEERMLRLRGLMTTVEDLEELTAKLLKGALP